MRDPLAPGVRQPVDLGEDVADPGREDDGSAGDPFAAVENDVEDRHIIPTILVDLSGHDTSDLNGGVSAELFVCGSPEVGRWHAVVAEHVVHVTGWGVAVVAGVEQQCGAAYSTGTECGLQTGRAATDDDQVIGIRVC